MQARYRWTLTDLANPGTPHVLTLDPIGWDELSCKLSRDEFYKGVFIDFTIALRFHCNGGGKQFIDAVYEAQDIQAVIELLIEFDCDSSGTYGELYTGRLNLASYKTDGEYTSVNIERSELFSKLKSRDTISVDVETQLSIGNEAISAVTPINLPTPSMEIKYENEWFIEAGRYIEYVQNFSYLAGWDNYFTHRMPILKDDFDTTKPNIEYEEFGEQPSDNKDFRDTFIQSIFDFDGTLNGVAVDVPITLNYELRFHGSLVIEQLISDAHQTVNGHRLVLIKGTKNTQTVTTLYNTAGAPDIDIGVPTPLAFDTGVLSGTIVILPGQSLWLAWRSFGTVGSGGSGSGSTLRMIWEYNESYLKFNSITTYSDGNTTAKSMLVHEVLTQVSDAISDTDNSFQSNYYGRQDSEKRTYAEDGCGSMRVITNGLNIREFNRPIFCSLRDLFQSLAAIDNIGLAIENDTTIRVEKIEYFFQNVMTINLTNPVKVETINDNTRYINRVIIGYDKWDTDFKGGLQEPNAKHEYSTLINAVNGEYTRTSKYLASAFAIELTRRKNISRFPDEDFRYDNDNFFIQVIRAAYPNFTPELYDDSFSSGSGMDAIATAYNLRLTPSRMLLAHFNAIVAGLQTINGQVKFVRGDGNTNLIVSVDDNGCQEEYSGAPLAENQSFNYNDANVENVVPLWGTERYSFEYPLTATQLTTIRANPHGYIQFIDDHGNTRKGFILNVDFKMKTGKTKFDLLKKFE